MDHKKFQISILTNNPPKNGPRMRPLQTGPAIKDFRGYKKNSKDWENEKGNMDQTSS